MYQRDRLTGLSLLGAAVAAWLVVAYVLTRLDPVGDPGALLAGALALGSAVALTLTPLFWLSVFARARRIAYWGDWLRAGRRGALVGLLVALFVILRGQDMFSLPLALFIIAMAVLVELTLSLRR
ncbi:MAG TPA: hypothetical protein VMP67_12740 [Candidatus Limnocylindria bacterium]|nr:hypothetical protein [Candidatus Limnocylindria bacterium]